MRIPSLFMRSLVRGRSGTTALEYALIAVLIALALVGIIEPVGAQLSFIIQKLDAALAHIPPVEPPVGP